MKALNLYLISQVDDETVFRQYTNILARRDPSARVRENEQESIHSLVRTVSGGDPDYGAWDRFFLSFSIAHIGKEFDLLKIRRDGSMVINIELKSEMTGEERIFRQLVQNRYYLGLITGNIHSYTYVSSTEEVFSLGDDGKLRRATKEELRELLLKTDDSITAIGFDVGFQSSSYFCSIFKKATNMTPNEYRSMHEGMYDDR